jgi:hypothetical protein
MDFLNINISIYRNSADNIGTVGTLGGFLGDRSRDDEITRLRNTPDDEERKRIKKALPCATIGGVFLKRNKENLILPSHLICVDIDGKDNDNLYYWKDFKKFLGTIPYIFYSAISVGGKGYFAIFRATADNPDEYGRQFEMIKQDFTKYGVKLDATPDVCRLRILTLDNEPYINSNAVPYKWMTRENVRKLPPMCSELGTSGDDTLTAVADCCKQIVQQGISIDDYTEWFKMVASLSTLGEPGREYAHIASSTSVKYNQRDTDRHFNNCVKNVRSIKIGTFFNICKEHRIFYKH